MCEKILLSHTVCEGRVYVASCYCPILDAADKLTHTNTQCYGLVLVNISGGNGHELL